MSQFIICRFVICHSAHSRLCLDKVHTNSWSTTPYLDLFIDYVFLPKVICYRPVHLGELLSSFTKYDITLYIILFVYYIFIYLSNCVEPNRMSTFTFVDYLFLQQICHTITVFVNKIFILQDVLPYEYTFTSSLWGQHVSSTKRIFIKPRVILTLWTSLFEKTFWDTTQHYYYYVFF